MDQIELTNRFVEKMIDARERLNGMCEDIHDKVDSVGRIIEEFTEGQNALFESVSREIKNEGARECFSRYADEFQGAVGRAAEEKREYLDSTKFIKKFEKTFIVSVFGKVKSGKSYLGNYIMGNAFRKNNIRTDYDKLGKIDVLVQDRGKLAKNQSLSECSDEDGFGVDSIEATSTIQYFEIGGLTWIDTPGIGSVTKENEELAEEYIKNSDLVVFACNSDAAGTQQEFLEMEDLHQMKKPILLLITQSDTYDEDCDDEGNLIQLPVPKSEKDREDVEKYMLEELKNKGMDEILKLSGNEVLTISTKLANEAVDRGNPKMFDASNIGKFLERLIDITENEAAKMKLNTPKDRFNKYVSALIATISSLDKAVKQIRDDADKKMKESGRIKENVLADIKSRCQTAIRSELSKYKGDTADKIPGQKIAAAVAEKMNRIIQETCAEGLAELISDLDLNDLIDPGNLDIDDIEVKTVEKKYDVQVQRRERVERGGGILGKIVDFFAGPKYMTTTETETRTVNIALGNNASQIENALLNHFSSVSAKEIDNQINVLIEGYKKPLDTISSRLAELVNETVAKLEKIKL